MTSEDDLQAKLDETPQDFDLRGVLADFLGDLGDPREPGYRALAKWRVWPRPAELDNATSDLSRERINSSLPHYAVGVWYWLREGSPSTKDAVRLTPHCLPFQWFQLVRQMNKTTVIQVLPEVWAEMLSEETLATQVYEGVRVFRGNSVPPTSPYVSRREAEDEAAKCFLMIPKYLREAYGTGSSPT